MRSYYEQRLIHPSSRCCLVAEQGSAAAACASLELITRPETKPDLSSLWKNVEAETSWGFSSNHGSNAKPPIPKWVPQQLIQTAGRINFIYRMLLGKCQVKKVWKQSYKDKLVIACFTEIVLWTTTRNMGDPQQIPYLISACYFYTTLSLLDWNKPTTACWQLFY